jgi:TonB family protein
MMWRCVAIAILLAGCAHKPVEQPPEPVNEKWLEENAAQHNHEVMACYQKRLKAKPKLTGEVDLEFTADTGGDIQEIKLSKSIDPEVDHCVLEAAKTWKFPWNVRRGSTEVGLRDKFKIFVEHGQPRSEFQELQLSDNIRKVIRQHEKEVAECYESALKENPKLTGKVILSWDIDEGGVVRAPTVKQSLQQDVDMCLVGHLKTWKFEPPAKNMVQRVSYPFLFSSQ